MFDQEVPQWSDNFLTSCVGNLCPSRPPLHLFHLACMHPGRLIWGKLSRGSLTSGCWGCRWPVRPRKTWGLKEHKVRVFTALAPPLSGCFELAASLYWRAYTFQWLSLCLGKGSGLRVVKGPSCCFPRYISLPSPDSASKPWSYFCK